MNCERVEGTPDPSLAIDGGINLKNLKKKKRKKRNSEVLNITGGDEDNNRNL